MLKQRLDRLEEHLATHDAPRTTRLTIRWCDFDGRVISEKTRAVHRIKTHDNVILTVEYDE